MLNPNIYFLGVGSGEGKTSLNSFDGALLDAGVGNVNLVKLSSILPPGCQQVNSLVIPAGSLLPIAYAALTSDHSGATISSAVAVAIPQDSSLPGVIMEYSAAAPTTETEVQVRAMVEEAMHTRKIDKFMIKSKAIEAKVNNITTTFAGVALWRK